MDDFCAFILTHGRADRVLTYNTLRGQGYTGKIYIVIDDEDSQADAYRERYGDEVLQFCKVDVAKTFDEGDNFKDRRAIVYARNACWGLAEQVGCKYFIQLDDDYTTFNHTLDVENVYLTKRPKVRNLNAIFASMVDFLQVSPKIATIAFSQGGDFIGGEGSNVAKKMLSRKAMNSFVCSIEKPFKFSGRLNEDVNTYTAEQRKGHLFFTFPKIRLEQKQTQSNNGGMTDIYLDGGTYKKSFYTVLFSPSCAKIAMMGHTANRIHHRVSWNACAPKIIRETHRKAQT